VFADRTYEISYTLSSSKQIGTANELTPYAFNETVPAGNAKWHNIYGIEQGQQILISFTASAGGYFDLYYPNQTLAYEIWAKTPIFQFTANESGTYLLRVFADRTYNISYTANSSHQFDTTTTTPTPTVTPSNSPTSSPTVQTDIGDPVTFQAPTNLLNDTSDYLVWNFGDGTTITTKDTAVTHTYNETGSFTVSLKVEGLSGEKVVQTYVIAVNPKTNQISLIIPLIAASITAGTTLLIYFLNRRTQKNKEHPKTNKTIPKTPKQ
jgi:hypothetical protein